MPRQPSSDLQKRKAEILAQVLALKHLNWIEGGRGVALLILCKPLKIKGQDISIVSYSKLSVFKLEGVDRKRRFTNTIYPTPYNTPLQYKVGVLLGQGIHRYYRYYYYIPSLKLSLPSPLVSSSCLSYIFLISAKKRSQGYKDKREKGLGKKTLQGQHNTKGNYRIVTLKKEDT